MKTRMFVAWVGLIGGVLLMTGCGGGDSDSGSGGESSAETSNTSVENTSTDQHRLVGVWLGVAYVEDAKLKAKLDQITDPNVKQSLISQAQTFQSMLVGADFQLDGSYTLDAEITPYGGQPARDQSAGSWEISSEVDEMVMVKATESGADGTQEETFKQYTFVDDDHFIWIPSVSADLQECDAMVVFERQPAPTEVATQPESGTETK